MNRVPFPDPDQFSPAKKAALSDPNARRLLNVSRMVMHAPDPLWAAMATLGKAVVYSSEMDPGLREIAILCVAYLSQSDYELFHHESISAALGFSPEKLAHLRDGHYQKLTPVEQAVAEFTAETVKNVSPTDATLAALREHFSDRLLMDLVIIIGTYMTVARVAAVTGVPNDEVAVKSWTAPALDDTHLSILTEIVLLSPGAQADALKRSYPDTDLSGVLTQLLSQGLIGTLDGAMPDPSFYGTEQGFGTATEFLTELGLPAAARTSVQLLEDVR